MIKTYKPNDTARIEAMLFTVDNQDALKWADGDLAWRSPDVEEGEPNPFRWQVKTLEGWVDMPYGSYLIRGTTGEFYPCDPDIFEKRWIETDS